LDAFGGSGFFEAGGFAIHIQPSAIARPHRHGMAARLRAGEYWPVSPLRHLRRAVLSVRMTDMTPHDRAESCWYHVAGLVSREQKDLAVEIIEAEMRSAQHEVLLEAAKLVLSGEPIVIARQLRDRAERTIRPKGTCNVTANEERSVLWWARPPGLRGPE